MSLRLCPDCEHHHRGPCVVCRPCARQRLVTYSGTRLFAVSRETVPVDAINAAVLSNIREREQWRDTEEVAGKPLAPDTTTPCGGAASRELETRSGSNVACPQSFYVISHENGIKKIDHATDLANAVAQVADELSTAHPDQLARARNVNEEAKQD